jgi:hypothetical protein
VQDSSGKLIFNLVPTSSGATTRTLSGTWTDSNGTTKILIGTETPEGEIPESEAKKLLPPGLVEILPLITALGTIVAMVGGVVAMLWIGKQWKEKNLERAEKEAKARENPDDEELQDDAEEALVQEQQGKDAKNLAGDNLQAAADKVEELNEEEEEEIPLIDNRRRDPLPEPEDVQADLEAVQQAQQEPELQAAAEQLAEQVDPSPIVLEGEEAAQSGDSVTVENGPLMVDEEA